MDYRWRGHAGSVWSDVIARHAEIANGWTDADLAEMKSLLTGTPMILDGRLRLMPARAKHMKIDQPVATVREMVAKAEVHMQAGRIPILKQETLDGLIEAAKQREIERYGRPLRSARKHIDPQRKLF